MRKASPLSYSLTVSILQDYEYSSYNPIAYDIANHFCEMVADYHTDTPHILDYNKYPGKLKLISDDFCNSSFTVSIMYVRSNLQSMKIFTLSSLFSKQVWRSAKSLYVNI